MPDTLSRVAVVERMALVGGDGALDAQHGGVLGEAPPRGAGGEVQDDEPRAAFVGGVDDEGGGHVRAEVEADVVHVGVRVVDGAGEGVGRVDGVIG